jgi:hypothetical protein
MSELQQKMIDEAVREHKRIYPCTNKKDLSECFTRQGDKLLFWFNTEDRTTHVIYYVTM